MEDMRPRLAESKIPTKILIERSIWGAVVSSSLWIVLDAVFGMHIFLSVLCSVLLRYIYK